MSIIFIYTLIDPRNNHVRYVGKSINPERRYKEHLYSSKNNKTKKERWIFELLKLKLTPILNIVYETDNLNFEKWETYFISKYKADNFDLTNYDDFGIGIASNIKALLKRSLRKTRKKIIKYDLNGIEICRYNSMRHAERETGINHGNIGRVCNYLWKHSGGYIFRYENDTSKIYPLKNPNSQKKIVVKLNENNEIIEEYESIAQAAQINNIDAGNLSRICNSKVNNLTKFKFKKYE